MIFQIDIAFALELLGLIAAAGLLLGSQKAPGLAAWIAKAVGLFGIVAAIAAMSCTAYYAMQYRKAGYFEKPLPANAAPAEAGGGMGDECPMMKQMKEKMKKNEDGSGEEEPQNPHEGHH